MGFLRQRLWALRKHEMANVDVFTHDLGAVTGEKLRLLPPVAPGPPDLDGRVVSNQIMALGLYAPEAEAHLLAFFNLRTSSRAGAVVTSQPERLSTMLLPGAMTDLHVTDLDGSWVQLAAGLSTGGLLFVRLLMPRTPGTGPEDIVNVQWPGSAEDDGEEGGQGQGGGALVPQLQLHKGAVASVDVQADTKAVLTVGADGGITIIDPDAAAAALPSTTTDTRASLTNGARLPPFRRPSPLGGESYTAGRWADSNVFVAASASGPTLHVFDTRVGRSPVLSSAVPDPVGRDGAPARLAGPAVLHSLAVHPSRPNLCASGSSAGEVALWDLRLSSAPTVALVPPNSSSAGVVGGLGAGQDVWEVRFDPAAPATSLSWDLAAASTPGAGVGGVTSGAGGVGAGAPAGVLFCTAHGVLGSAAFQGAPGAAAGSRGAVNGFSSGFGSSMFGGSRSSANSKAVCQALASAHHGVVSLDVDQTRGGDIVAVTQGGQLLHVRRRL